MKNKLNKRSRAFKILNKLYSKNKIVQTTIYIDCEDIILESKHKSELTKKEIVNIY